MSGLASLEAEQRGSWLLLRIRGEVDISNAHQLSAAIEAAVPNGTPRIVVDLTHTAYLDSAGVKLLVQLSDRLRARRRELRLVVPRNAPIRAVLELTGLPRLVHLVDRLEEAPGAPTP
ncbi:MAG TPA: STAS domain-containing protein [Actinomycetota bacterium]